jgi:hypothetical protein
MSYYNDTAALSLSKGVSRLGATLKGGLRQAQPYGVDG